MRQPSYTRRWLLLAVLASTCGMCLSTALASNDHVGKHVGSIADEQHSVCFPSFCGPAEIPFDCTVNIEYRRVWSGMRGGRFTSGTLGRRRNSNEFHSGGAYDVAMFLWTQMVISGKCPHPGPPGSDGNNSTSGVVPLRVTASTGDTSSNRGVHLYDVYAKIHPASNISYKEAKKHLRKLSKPVEWLTLMLDRKCHFVGSITGQNASPALFSLMELHQFVTFVQTHHVNNSQSKQLQLKANVRRFFQDHTPQLAVIWPTETQFEPKFVHPPPSSVNDSCISPITEDTWQIKASPTSVTAMRNLSEAMGIQILPCAPDVGVYTTTVEVQQIAQLVELLGIYSCSKFVQNTVNKRAQPYIHVRYQCFRGAIRKSKAGLVPGKKQRDGQIGKCSCPASISGNYKASTATNTTTHVHLSLDLRHVGHEPGTTADARLLPLLPDVKNKLDNLTCLFRNMNLVRKYIDRWVREEYLPETHPGYKQSVHMLDRRFNPTDKDIQNSTATSGRKLQFSNVDQESTFLLIASQAETSWVLRPAQGDTTAYTRLSASAHVCATRVIKETHSMTTAQLSINSVSHTSATYFKDVVGLCYHMHLNSPGERSYDSLRFRVNNNQAMLIGAARGCSHRFVM